MKLKISKVQSMLIGAILGAVIALGVYGFLFFEIKNKNNQASILQNQLDIEIRKDQRLRSIKQLLSELHVEVDTVDRYFVGADEVVDFLEELELLGNIADASVEVNSVSVSEGGEAIPYEHLRVEFHTQDRWVDLIHIVSLLETMPYGVRIERSQIERVPNSTLWQAHIIFTVLKLK
ncbi:MAG: hypothetical protein OQJ98_02485 [Candidatus Pacebacteria bacterium]|nr:hypothetical protein [Candidatus Paceibacterota bacterium]